MRSFVAGLACLYCCSLMGCSLLKRAHNYQETAQKEYHDEWQTAGQEGRGGMTRQKETDKLTPWLESPEARSINKNLGFD